MKIFSEDAIYLQAYFEHRDEEGVGLWRSKVCNECGSIEPTLLEGGPGQNTIEHVNRPEVRRARDAWFAWIDKHLVDDEGIVLIGCEGYHQINPNALGLNRPDWSDWIGEIGAAEDEVRDPRFGTWGNKEV